MYPGVGVHERQISVPVYAPVLWALPDSRNWLRRCLHRAGVAISCESLYHKALRHKWQILSVWYQTGIFHPFHKIFGIGMEFVLQIVGGIYHLKHLDTGCCHHRWNGIWKQIGTWTLTKQFDNFFSGCKSTNCTSKGFSKCSGDDFNFSRKSYRSVTPRPVRPTTPAECDLSIITMALYFSASS